MQITMSPYYGKPDFGAVADHLASPHKLDLVSLADLLRNGFVYPPHSILQNVKLATFGFDPEQDMSAAPEYRFPFDPSDAPRTGGDSKQLVATWHRLLCEALERSCHDMRAPWLLQSAGKDSTSLAIAAKDVRPDTTCITYHGGTEEDEVASANAVASKLGLRSETLRCDPGRAYDAYLANVARMPLLTADFALLSYVDLATAISGSGGDGVIDGLGSDGYFGMPVSPLQRLLSALALGIRLPAGLTELPLVSRSFRLCYALSTLQMDRVERVFPGSRFTDAEIDQLFGWDVAHFSKARVAPFRAELAATANQDELRTMAVSIEESASALAKGLYTAHALALKIAYPYCDRSLRNWVRHEVPLDHRVHPGSGASKALVREHIATHFGRLPYVEKKGSFRFNLRGLARARFDQVHAHAVQAATVLPGAAGWLERNRRNLGNKYHASKFYLLAIACPWIACHDQAGVEPGRERNAHRTAGTQGASYAVSAR
jgi:asparagine synthase (glutamine-hydrolysing)